MPKPSNEYNLVLHACSGDFVLGNVTAAMQRLAGRERIPVIFNGLARAIVAHDMSMLILMVHRLRRARANLFEFKDVRVSDEWCKANDSAYERKGTPS